MHKMSSQRSVQSHGLSLINTAWCMCSVCRVVCLLKNTDDWEQAVAKQILTSYWHAHKHITGSYKVLLTTSN